jgi:uncharacterized HAD superfamily protein
MFFKSLDDLNRDIINNLYKIPRDIDLIVGIPRSGLLVANLIALYLNLPLVDLNGFIEGRIFESGKTRRIDDYDNKINNIRKVLIVEDSILSGKSMLEAKTKLERVSTKFELIYFVAYIIPSKKKDVDIYLDICELPRVFEWNIIHHSIVEESCFDMDGVLCINPKDKENDDGNKYINFINTAKPLFIPTKKIGNIVTCRLEKYRQQTENWLNKNKVKYNKLIMMKYNSKEDRIKYGNHAEFKAKYYIQSKASLFVESDINQAIKIAKIAKKPVYCIEARKMIYANSNINELYLGKPSLQMKLKFKIHCIITWMKSIIKRMLYS